jgi:hypothetical protein
MVICMQQSQLITATAVRLRALWLSADDDTICQTALVKVGHCCWIDCRTACQVFPTGPTYTPDIITQPLNNAYVANI